MRERGSGRTNVRPTCSHQSTRAFYAGGYPAWQQKRINVPLVVVSRGDAFGLDHTQLKLWLRTKQRRKWVRVWLTVVLDLSTRRVMGWAISLHPNTGVVFAALRRAFSGSYGCLPSRLVSDNGPEIIANAVTEVEMALGIAGAPIDPRSPWQNGKVERFFETLNSRFIRRQPFAGEGPRGKNGLLYGPRSGPLCIPEFVRRLEEAIDDYNNTYHSEIGMTPNEAWEADETPLRKVDERELDFMLTERRRSVVRGYGIRHDNTWYVDEEAALLSHQGGAVYIAYVPFDLRQIWVFDDNERFICKAKPWAEVTEEGRTRLIEGRNAELNALRAKLPAATMDREEFDAAAADADPPLDELPNSAFLPVTAPSDFEAGTPQAADPAADNLPDQLREVARKTQRRKGAALAPEHRSPRFSDLTKPLD